MTTGANPPDFGELMNQMQRLQESLEEMKQESASRTIEGSAGGGLVKVSVSGEFDFVSVHLDPSVIDKREVDVLEDLLLVALRDAAQKVNAARQSAVGNVMNSALSELFTASPPELSGEDTTA